MHTFYLEVRVSDEHAEEFKRLACLGDDHDLRLDVERIIGARLSGDTNPVRELRARVSPCSYGPDIVEVDLESP